MERQSKMSEYLNKKKSGFNPNIKPTGLPGTRPPDPDSRECSDAQTQRLSDDPISAEFQKSVCPLFFLITPQDHNSFNSIHAKLQALSKKNSSKPDVIAFIREQVRVKAGIARIESVDMKNLENIMSIRFWDKVVPVMVKRALEKKLKPIRLLTEKSNSVVTVTRGQVFTILAHMFLCTLPEQFYRKDVCFNEYFNGTGFKSSNRFQKLKCLVAYFQAMIDLKKEQLQENIIFQRVYNPVKAYMQGPIKMSNVSIVYKNIEEYKGEMMVDFANKNLGGGVLKNGCVQEEILFVTHPELFMCCLLYNTLSDGECALVHGCYQYTKYEGYSGSFAYKGPIHEVPKIDCFSKHSNTFVVIDALNFNQGVFKNTPQAQYRDGMVNRQIHKAYLGFSNTEYIDQSLAKKRIVTGKWGCGAFGGDPELKFVIQWLAASWADRNMMFVNWGEEESQSNKQSNFEQLLQLLKNLNTVQVRNILKRYNTFTSTQKVKLKLSDYVAEFFF